MTTSYNGWLASQNPADFGGLDNREVPGTNTAHLSPGVRAGAVATVLFYVAAQLHARVENGDLYTPGDEWGYYYKNSANSAALISCHSSGTAFDWNATRHPNGKRGTFTAAQVAEIRKILAEVNNVVYWGGDAWDGGTPDEMHFEIDTGITASQVAAAAAKVTGSPAPAPAPAPAPVPVPPALPRWSLPAGAYYGNIAGPAASRGGATAAERAVVKLIQQWFIYHGCVPGVNPASWATSGWADGKWENATDVACINWHNRFYTGQPKPAQIWSDDYARLGRA